LQEAVQKRSAFRARYRVAHTANFDERWIATSGTVFVEDGAARRVIGLCYDVTERANLEIELRSRVKQQEALAQLAERALAEPDLERLLNDAANTIALTLNVDFAKILELLPGDIELLLRTGYGWKSDLAGSLLTTTAPNSFARITLDSAAPVIVDDFDAETRFEVPSYLKDHNCKSLWHPWRLHDQEEKIPAPRHFVFGRDRQPFGWRYSAPPARTAPRTDDPRHAASLGQSVLAALGIVFTDGADFEGYPRSHQQVSGARPGDGECPASDH
jgi:hypothetical protein